VIPIFVKRRIRKAHTAPRARRMIITGGPCDRHALTDAAGIRLKRSAESR
jgi:hypothetical protein